MKSTKPLYPHQNQLVNQILVAVIKNRSFDAHPAASASVNPNSSQIWAVKSVSEVLRSMSRYFFQSTRSIGRQQGFRYRAPLRQRKLNEEAEKIRNNMLVLGPAAYRDPLKVSLGLDKAIEVYYWVLTHFGFVHNEITCREMACVLAKGNRLKARWEFLKDMSRRGGGGFVTTATVTCLIKVLGEEGFVNEAWVVF